MGNNDLQNQIAVKVTINAPVDQIWKVWSSAEDIMQWNAPSDTWLTSLAEIDFRTNGRFLFRMEAKDKSSGFDYGGIYTEIVDYQLIRYTGDDGRISTIMFVPDGISTHITEIFDADIEIPIELQRDFCLGVLNNLKKYTESKT